MKLRVVWIPALILCLFLSGCRSIPISFSSRESTVMTCGRESMTEAEVRLIALQYKCRFEYFYSELLGDDFWSEKVYEGIDFEAYVKEYFVYRECKALLYLSALADSRGLTIDEYYDKDFAAAAEKYYGSLSKDELRYTGADEEDIEKLMRRYAIASMEIEEEIAKEAPEVSFEESRVADIEVIRVSDGVLAEELSRRLSEGVSFLTLAQENTLDSRIEYSVYKGELLPVLDELVFSMDTYEISRVTEVGDSFYLIRLVNSYNELMSKNHKNNLLSEKRFLAWESLIEAQEKRVSIRRNRRSYENITLKKDGDFPLVDLFENIPVIN